MTLFDDLAKSMLASFDSKDLAREEAYRLSREVIRNCSSSIRSLHRGELSAAEDHMSQAGRGLDRIRAALCDHQDVIYAGFVDGAEQEYAEATCVYSIIVNHTVPMPKEVGVLPVNYLGGLGDVTGELRRHILDLIRADRARDGEYFLEVMEDIYHLLMLFDYPDAITRGLRRKSDLARSMLERTRGDLTNALELAKTRDMLKGRQGIPNTHEK